MKTINSYRLMAVVCGVFAVVLPQFVLADLYVICNGLAGCGAGGANVLAEDAIPVAATALIKIAAGLSVVFVVISGYRMVISAGDESKFTAGRQGIIYSLLGLAVSVTATWFVGFVITENYGQANPTDFIFGPGGLLASVIDIISAVFNVSLLLVVIYAGIQMVLGAGKTDSFQKGFTTIKYAIIGAVVVNTARWFVEATLQAIL
jgi:hypothetical protein